MDIFNSLSSFFAQIQPEHWYISVLLATFLFGETIIIIAFVLAIIQPQLLAGTFLVALLGTISADTFWYLIATEFIPRTRLQKFFAKKDTKSILQSLLHLFERRPHTMLLAIKFFAGMRIILSVSFINRTRIPFREFLIFDTIGATIFICVLLLISWTAQTGAAAFSTLHTLSTTLIVIVSAIIVFHLLSHALIHFLGQRQSD